jgi:hypothetical protein
MENSRGIQQSDSQAGFIHERVAPALAKPRLSAAPKVGPARSVPGSGLEAQQEPGSYGRKTGSVRRQGIRQFGDGGGREMTTCVGEIVEIVPPKK